MSEPWEPIKGLDLARAYDAEVIRPLVEERLPGLVHARGLIGPGSEVLGFDDEMSTDHGWGPRGAVWVRGRALVREVHEALDSGWPSEFRGWPTLPVAISDINTLFVGWLGFDPLGDITSADWMGTTSQDLAMITGGEIFHDGDGTWTEVRARLAWYPDDVWRWLLAAGWTRVGQELSFVGRTGDRGDDLGSRILAARLAHGLMRQCFLLERRYAPYAKWLGTGFAQLEAYATVGPLLEEALGAPDWKGRAQSLAEATAEVGFRQNELGLHEPVDVAVTPFFTRPFPVVAVGGLSVALLNGIADPVLRARPRVIGNIDQVTDSVDTAGNLAWRRLHTAWFSD